MSRRCFQVPQARFASIFTLAIATFLIAGAARAQFVFEENFDGDLSEWVVLDASTAPTVSGGLAAFDGADAIRSVDSFALGSIVRVDYTVLGGPGAIIGTNSNTGGGHAGDDAAYARNDSNIALRADGNPAGTYTTNPTFGTTAPGYFEFALGDTITIVQNGTTLLSTARPAGFDESQRIEFVVYGGGSMTIDRVTVVPEPASLALLGLPAAGLLLRRRRA